MLKYASLLFVIIVLFACGEKQSSVSSSDQPQDSVAATTQYFPVRDFLKTEIAEIDSTPVGIMKYRIAMGVTDSGYIQPGEFHLLAAEFLPGQIDDSVFSRQFTETSFFDKSSNAATFFYGAKDKSLPLQRVDVITAKGDVYDQVKSIYLEKIYRQGDTSITRKLYWKPKRNFQIITSSSKGKEEPVTELIKVVWDNRE